jgi:hypothetical protein
VRTILQSWRYNTKYKLYGHSPFTVTGFMPEATLTKLASARHIQTIEDIEQHTSWIYARRHGEDILRALKRVDDHVLQEKELAAQARKAETRQRQEEKRQEERRGREERKRQKVLETPRNNPTVKTPRQPLAGCLTLNLGLQTPSTIVPGHHDPWRQSNSDLSSPFGTLLDFQVTEIFHSSLQLLIKH